MISARDSHCHSPSPAKGIAMAERFRRGSPGTAVLGPRMPGWANSMRVSAKPYVTGSPPSFDGGPLILRTQTAITT